MADLMGRNQYARHRGCAPNAVAKAEADGRIAAAVVRDEAGKFLGINWRLADDLWPNYSDLDQAMRANGGALPSSLPGMGDAGPAGTQSAPQNPSGAAVPRDATRDESLRGELLEQKVRQQKADTKMRELDLAKRRGELVSMADEREVRAKRYRAMRDKLLGIADREAAVLAAERDAVQVHARLTSAIEQVLHELSDDARREAERGIAEPMAA